MYLKRQVIFLDFHICMQKIYDPEFGDRDHGYEIKKPILELGAHVAPTGIEFYKGNSSETYQNNAFITLMDHE